MRIFGLVVILWAAGLAGVHGQQTQAKPLTAVNAAWVTNQSGKAVWMTRVIIQPNGWGYSPKESIRDLDRVMGIYTNYPGFRRDKYVKVIHIARNQWQADGRCSYLAPNPFTKKGR